MKQDLSVALLHLLKRMCSIERCNRDITTIDNAKPLLEGINFPDFIITATFLLSRGACTDATGAKTGTGTIGGAGIIGEAENGDVQGLGRS